MTANDPTDEALAAIASIFEKPDAKAAAPDEVVPEEGSPSVPPSSDADTQGDEPVAAEAMSDSYVSDSESAAEPVKTTDEPVSGAVPEPDDSDDDLERYTREGPGPLDALRFKWRMRRDDRGYFVDETIGASVHPISSGPMSRVDAIALIEARDQETRRRFEALRHEIVMGPSERGYDEDSDELDDAR
ncbi:hypothetical protein KQX62_14855 [Rhodopseudomonas palustris]|uniref:Uncharacterized protein n=1 Tax=Rhodopseudomonas palustris TaxID=1076 RepID=A0AAX3DUB8_RHOPL|nr:hypothetical protein [Rhodopseudomonas palustris]UYO38017.1 hypothetical protein KQX62_14855 [Rhodopseudomonas palustris]